MRRICGLAAACFLWASSLHAQVPQIINYQGRVAVNGVVFSGMGQFNFALVNTNGSTTYWSNDGTSAAGSRPANAVLLTVTNGLYSVLLGDSTITNMTPIPFSVFSNSDVRLRVWFNDGADGWQLLSPDQRIAAVGYAMMAGSVPAGSITASQLAAGAFAAPVSVSGTTQTVVPNTAYTATSASQTIFDLPTTANVGDEAQITGAGAGGWSAAGFGWTAQSGSPSTNWASVASSADGTHLVAGVNGGQIYTSTDSGVTWTQQNVPGENWHSVASSADGTHLAAAAYGIGIYTSTDSGVTWTQQNLPGDINYNWVASSSDGSHLVTVVIGGQIYTSANFGVTWARQSGSPTANWHAVASSADGTHLVAVAWGGQIYTSPDSGVTWTAQSGAPSANWNSVASSADGTHLVAVVYGGQIYTSTNSGVTWTAQSGAPGSLYGNWAEWQSVASSADGTHLVAAAGNLVTNPPIYTSTDSGVTWTAPGNAPTSNWQSVASSSDGTHLVAVANFGQIYTGGIISIASGAQGSMATLQYLGNGQWAPVGQTQLAANAVVQAGNIAAGAVGASQLAANAVQAGNIAAGAVGTSQLATGAFAAPVSVSGSTQAAAVNTAYVATSASQTTFNLPAAANVGDEVQITGAGAGGWSALANGWTAQGGDASWVSLASSSDGTHLVGAVNLGPGTYGGPIWTSTNSGVNGTSGPPTAFWNAVASSSDGTHLVAVASGSPIYTSTNSGVTWTAQTNAPSANWNSVASSSDGTHLVASVNGGAIYTSTNSGVTWTQQNVPNLNWNWVASSSDGTHLVAVEWEGDVYMGGQIYTSTDSGVTWTAQTNAPNAGWVSVASSSDGTHLVAAVAGGQIYTGLINSIVSSGGQGSTATLVYLGNGQWAAVKPASSP